MATTDRLTSDFDQVPLDALESFVDPLLKLVGELTGMESSYLTRVDLKREIQEVIVARNTGELALAAGLLVPWQDTLCRRTLAADSPACANVSQAWPDAEAAIGFGINSLVSLPVRLSDGELWGTLCSASGRSIEADETAISIMQACARLIAQQIELFQRARMAEQSLGRMALVARASQVCLDAQSLEFAVSDIAQALKSQSFWPQVLPFMLDGNRVRTLEQMPAHHDKLIQSIVALLGDHAFRQHDERHSPLIDQDNLPASVLSGREAFGLSPIGPTALLTAATPNQLQAGIVLLANESAELDARDEQMLVSCSNALSLLTDRLFHHGALVAHNEALHEEASKDALTGLPNRRSLIERLEYLTRNLDRSNQHLLVAFIDLDGFKKINDVHGHEAGDLFLVSIAHRLTGQLRSDDWVARLGGDEFVVVTTAGSTREADDIARHVSERIDQAIVGSHDIGTTRIDYPGASIGVVQWLGESPAELLRRADEAMYTVKHRRRGNDR